MYELDIRHDGCIRFSKVGTQFAKAIVNIPLPNFQRKKHSGDIRDYELAVKVDNNNCPSDTGLLIACKCDCWEDICLESLRM